MNANIQPFVEHFDAARASLPGAECDWVNQLRGEAMDRFTRLGFPTVKEEAWRYTNLRPLHREAFENTSPAPIVAVDAGAAHRLVFVNGTYAPAMSSVDRLPEGVALHSLRHLLDREPAVLKAHLGRLGGDGDGAMTALNTALMADGYVLRLGRGVVVEDPIELLFIGGGATPTHFHYRNLVVAEPGASATLCEDHMGTGDAGYFSNAVSDFQIHDDAQIRHYKMQDEAVTAYHLHSADIQVRRGGRFESFVLSLGGRLARNSLTVTLDGRGAECRLDGAYLGDGTQHLDNTTYIDHAAADTHSRETYKGVLDGNSRAAFQGTILVREHSQRITGHQLHRALLLSYGAEVDSKPALEIYADDVKCSHGATTGALDPQQLFYLRARGIPEREARMLLIKGFLQEVVDDISSDIVRAAFGARIADRLD